MKLPRKWMYWATALPVFGMAGLGLWKHSQPSPAHAAVTTTCDIVMSVKPGSPVNRVEHLTFEVRQGWPVVLVRDANDKSPWWVQGRAERQDARTYLARAHFGNEKTVPGQRYQIVVLSVADESAAQQFETGTTLEEFPVNVPCSEPIEVVRR